MNRSQEPLGLIVCLPRNFQFNRMLPLRGVDCALHEAFGRLVGIECGIALKAELVVLDLFKEWVRRTNHVLQI
jgi:hypothetical protein